MFSTFFGTKLNTSQAFDDKGNRLVITNVKAEPLTVTQIKTKATDGYHALQVAIGKKSVKSLTKPLKNHLKKAKLKAKAPLFIHEIRLAAPSDFKVGDQVSMSDVFKLNDLVKVTGTSKGKGFAGGMKRWGFAGGPKTHGQSDRPRSIGSIGQRTDPGRVWKGKKMPGHLGNVTKTVLKLQIVSISSDKNLLKIAGTVPGSINGLLKIVKTASAKKPIKLYAKN